MTLRASSRDASWYPNPNVVSFKSVHVDIGDWFAACDRRMPLDGSLGWDAVDVPDGLRCRRPACALRFRAADSLHAHRLLR